MTTRCLAVTGVGSIGKCSRLSQPSWLLVCTIIILLTYLLGDDDDDDDDDYDYDVYTI